MYYYYEKHYKNKFDNGKKDSLTPMVSKSDKQTNITQEHDNMYGTTGQI